MRKDTLFAKIGELTVQYATLEHQLQSLLLLLLAESNQLIGPFFVHELSLSILLRKIRHIARYRLPAEDRLLERLEGILKRIDATRDLRNLLIHGNWQIEEDCVSCPVTVLDYKMKFENGRWQDQTQTTFNEKRLTHLTRRLQGMGHEIQHLTEQLQRA